MHVKHRAKSGRHRERVLTALAVRNLFAPGRYHDGNGLYLVVSGTGGRRWMLRIVVDGRRRDIGLGGASLVGLAEARERAIEYRRLARQGGDPLAERRRQQAGQLLFSDAARRVFDEHKASWRNAKHAQQWINTLEQYATPIIGDLAVERIGPPDIMRVLSPIWLSKPETARRVRQRLGRVFDWAKASGFRSGDNPVHGITRGLPKQTDRDVHHAAVPYRDVPAFIQRLHSPGEGELSRLAFEFLILTASRTGEVLGALKSEIDYTNRLWSVPPERMKAHVEHRVPLSDQCLAILRRAEFLAPDGPFLFPSRAGDRPLSNMVFLATLRRMKVNATGHGFRSSFRDWAAEATSYSGDLAEMALAHTIKNKVEAAYRRGDLLEQRRSMMERWSQFCSSTANAETSVEPIAPISS